MRSVLVAFSECRHCFRDRRTGRDGPVLGVSTELVMEVVLNVLLALKEVSIVSSVIACQLVRRV